MKAEKLRACGFSPARLQVLDATLQRYIDSGRRPGLNALVLRRGEVCFARAYGCRDPKSGARMELDSLFRVFSLTKIVTAVAALILWEQGRFQLNDPVDRYLPEFGDLSVMDAVTADDFSLVPAEGPILIRDLFLHTAGLAYFFPYHPKLDRQVNELGIGMQRPPDSPELTLAEFAAAAAHLPLVAQPGQRWSYSFATDILARVVEVVAEQPFAEFLQVNIFQPLGMNDTGFWVNGSRRRRLTALAAAPDGLPPDIFARLEKDSFGSGYFPSPEGDPFVQPGVQPRGGHGLIAAISDYGNFLQCLLNGGSWRRRRILGRKTVEFARGSHLRPEQLPFENLSTVAVNPYSRSFGYFGETVLDPMQKGLSLGSAGEFTWAGWAGTWFSVDPQENLVLLLFTQYIAEAGRLFLWHDFRNGVYQALED